MTKDLHYTIPAFFEARMSEHSSVVECVNKSTKDFFLYEVRRRRHSNLLVWLSDAYRFGDMDYLNRPAQMKSGDYILVAKPEGGFLVSSGLIEQARIGVGQIGRLMGALTWRKPWEYLPPDERERVEQHRR